MPLSNRVLIELLDDESFVRWITGRASQPEQERWELWLQEDSANQELKQRAERLYELPLEPSNSEGDDLQIQLKRLNKRIDKDDKDEGQKISKSLPAKHINLGYRISVAAAIVLLVGIVSVISLYYPVQGISQQEKAPLFTTIEIDYGEKGSLKISDGSHIQLNANSSLRYSPEQFNTDRVEVWLEGEGYFDITNNPGGQEREFIVHTPNGDVQVLGTKFNVNTRFRETSVVLEEGSVKVSLRDTTQAGPMETILKPGEQLTISGISHDFELRQVDVKMMTAWLEGRMEFSGTSLRRIIASVEAMYGVSLVVEQSSLLKQQVTGSIQNPNLQTLLTGLEKVLKLKIIQRDGGQYMITKQSIQKEKP